MSTPLSVAVLSFWHVHAADYSRSTQRHPDTTLVAVWDDDETRGRAGAADFGVEYTSELDALLAREDIDAVIVTTATVQHHEIMMKAIAAGKHIFTEKLLAPTVEQAEELIEAAAERGIALVVSLPRLYEGHTKAVADTIASGKLGELTYTRVRLAHNGWVAGWLPERFADKESAIGGALTDLGCHPVYLTQLFLGSAPETVTANYAHVTGREVEDNAVVTVGYANGAIGVIEASNVTTPGAYTVEIRGTEGSLISGFGSTKILAKGNQFDPENWIELEVPANGTDAFGQWVGHIQSGTTAGENLRAAVELTRLVVAANASAEAGSSIRY